jgi:hypothetical protein
LDLSWDHIGVHRKKKCHNDHGVRGPQKIYAEASRGVHCTKFVRVHVSAHEGY